MKALSVLKYLTYKWVSIVGGRERLGPGLNSRVLNQKSKSVGHPRSLHSQQKAEAASPVARAAADLRALCSSLIRIVISNTKVWSKNKVEFSTFKVRLWKMQVVWLFFVVSSGEFFFRNSVSSEPAATHATRRPWGMLVEETLWRSWRHSSKGIASKKIWKIWIITFW